jgi:hypothetical protein
MLEALVQLGFLHEYDKGVFGCIHDPKSRRKAFSLGVLAMQGLHRGLEDVFLKLLILQGELFQCSGTEQQEFYWDKVREKFAQAKFYGAPWREAVNAALSEESTTATVPVSRASTAQLELCDVSGVGLSALLGS